mmetsp:Transcript_6253/g.17961  ORF Transcript_6253/g.17961 Transcript_6253/m.17961 type:complete len:211 (+) Transcript_6253:1712-2344(+)
MVSAPISRRQARWLVHISTARGMSCCRARKKRRYMAQSKSRRSWSAFFRASRNSPIFFTSSARLMCQSARKEASSSVSDPSGNGDPYLLRLPLDEFLRSRRSSFRCWRPLGDRMEGRPSRAEIAGGAPGGAAPLDVPPSSPPRCSTSGRCPDSRRSNLEPLGVRFAAITSRASAPHCLLLYLPWDLFNRLLCLLMYPCSKCSCRQEAPAC